MLNNTDFDELAQKTFMPEATNDDYERLFAAAFALSEWHFISNNSFPVIAPFCGIFPDFFENKPIVAVFTDTDRLRKYIAESNNSFGSANDSVVLGEADASFKFSSDKLSFSISPESFLEYMGKLIEAGVQGIFFNPNKDSTGFFNGLAQLRPIYEHLESKNMLPKSAMKSAAEEPIQPSDEIELSDDAKFDVLSKKAFETNAIEDLNKLFGAVFALENWEFIARGELSKVNPYIASRPDTADNQPMIHAFTDGKRLMNFAKENNLTRKDGSCDSLIVPTKEIVEYLEQFIAQGVHGIWFNSDTQSEGFFIPLKQLRPIKEHLAKPKQTSETAQTNVAILLVIIKDGLMLPSGFVSNSSYNCNLFCCVPQNWTENGGLKTTYLEKLYQQFYGENWRSGNSDGSRYIIIEANSAVIDDERVKGAKWNLAQNTELNRYSYYVTDANGAFKSVSGDEFQANVDASFQAQTTDEDRKRQDNLADFGMSETADGNFEQNININQVGVVIFATSIAPFYEAIVSLLENYQGSGNYLTLLAFDRNGMTGFAENIAENAHGAYLQLRRFIYINPKNNVRISVDSIHSNSLRHTETNAKLLLSFELCKNIDNQTAVFYHRFEGAKSEVFKLMAALQPVLESYNYQAISQ